MAVSGKATSTFFFTHRGWRKSAKVHAKSGPPNELLRPAGAAAWLDVSGHTVFALSGSRDGSDPNLPCK
jgi:hypothetical protein